MPKRQRPRSATITEDDDDLGDLAGLPELGEGSALYISPDLEKFINDEVKRRVEQDKDRRADRTFARKSNLGAWGQPRKLSPPPPRKPAPDPLDSLLSTAAGTKPPKVITPEFQTRLARDIASGFAEIAEQFELTAGQLLAVGRMVVAELEKQAAPPASRLPAKAPELWSKRDRSARENPGQFVRRVYARWLDKGLTRPHLFNLDEPLYRALSVWMHRHPDDPLGDLATVSKPLDEKIASLGALASQEELRRIGLAIQNRLRRQKARA